MRTLILMPIFLLVAVGGFNIESFAAPPPVMLRLNQHDTDIKESLAVLDENRTVEHEALSTEHRKET